MEMGGSGTRSQGDVELPGKMPKKLNPTLRRVLGASHPWIGRYSGTDTLPEACELLYRSSSLTSTRRALRV